MAKTPFGLRRGARVRRLAGLLALVLVTAWAPGEAAARPPTSLTAPRSTVPNSTVPNSTVPISTVPISIGAGDWVWPLAPPWRVLRGFEAPETHYSAGHRGIDMAAMPADAVFAPTASTVYFAGRVAGRPVLTLQPAAGLLVSFEPVETTLAKGQPVDRGEQVAVVASGGHCDGRCVHFGVRIDGEYVSPLLYYGGVPRAVLLPLE